MKSNEINIIEVPESKDEDIPNVVKKFKKKLPFPLSRTKLILLQD